MQLVPLTVENFFTYFAFNPTSPYLLPCDEKIAKIASVIFGIVTTGIGHLICYLFFYNEKSIKSIDQKTTELVKTVLANDDKNNKKDNKEDLIYSCSNLLSSEDISPYIPKNIQPTTFDEIKKDNKKALRGILVYTPNEIESDLAFGKNPDEAFFYRDFQDLNERCKDLMIIIDNSHANRWKKGLEKLECFLDEGSPGGRFAKTLMDKRMKGLLIFTHKDPMYPSQLINFYQTPK